MGNLIKANFLRIAMEKLEFVMLGSKGDQYKVVFKKQGYSLRAFCSCKAGRYGRYCRHRTEIMDGDITNLLSYNTEDVERLYDLLAGTHLESAYRKMLEEQNRYKEGCATLEQLRSLKNELSVAMYDRKE